MFANTRAVFVALALAASAIPACRAADTKPLRVSAAISLTESLEQAAEAFRRSTGRQVAVNYAASNVLAQQVIDGARVDMFLSADEAQMTRVVEAGLVDGTPVALWRNRLVVVMPSGMRPPGPMPGALADPAVRRIALGDPAGVPAGVYAKQWLERISLWAGVEAKVVPTRSVRAALAAVETANADAGIVYATDAAGHHGVTIAHEVTGPNAPRIVYPGAVLRTASDVRTAHELLAFLRDSDEARRIFIQAGFTPAERADDR